MKNCQLYARVARTNARYTDVREKVYNINLNGSFVFLSYDDEFSFVCLSVTVGNGKEGKSFVTRVRSVTGAGQLEANSQRQRGIPISLTNRHLSHLARATSSLSFPRF